MAAGAVPTARAGLRSSSPLEGVNPRGLTIRKLGSARPRLLRQIARRACFLAGAASLRKRFTIRSSSEWNVTTASRPPGFRNALGRSESAREARRARR